VLGTVLGALALGFFILALVLCLRRRKHRGPYPRTRALSPEDDEVESWRLNKSFSSRGSRRDSNHDLRQQDVVREPMAAPSMSQHPAYQSMSQHQIHENPFVPAPPPPRRSAPNSRAGLTDEVRPGEMPYLTERNSDRPLSMKGLKSSNGLNGAGLAVGSAALGAAAMHHRDKSHGSNSSDEKRTSRFDEDTSYRRRSGSVGQASTKEGWPYTPEDVHSMPANRQNLDNARRRSLSRDAARANAAFDNQYSPANGYRSEPFPSKTALQSSPVAHNAREPLMAGAAALGAGGALAQHKRHSKSRNSRPRYEDMHESSSASSGMLSDYDYAQGQSTRRNRSDSGPHELPAPFDIPPTPSNRSRRSSPLGTAAPSAAYRSYQNREPTLPLPHVYTEVTGPRASTPPTIPSRSPHRNRMSIDSTHYDSIASPISPLKPGEGEGSNEFPTLLSTSGRGIVGDNGYPQMNVARPRSGEQTHHKTVNNSRYPAELSSSSNNNSDDSTWRLSSGMPGGWQRDGKRSSMESTQANNPAGRTSQGPYTRDSGVSGVGGQRRLRLADLKREEEGKEHMKIIRERGGAGVDDDGFEYANVGQAM